MERTATEIVKEIHTAFDTAEDRLLKEAQQIINNLNNVDRSKAKRLADLGFINAKEAADLVMLQQESGEAQMIIQDIEYCRLKYPLYKYISKPAAREICLAYGLLIGEAFKYIGEIPDKNLAEIETFQRNYSQPENENLRQYPLTPNQAVSSITDRYKRSIEQDMRMYDSALDLFFRARQAEEQNERKTRQNKRPEFLIAAPADKFNVRWDDKIEEGHILINDPIVLCPIRHGYLIVSKWGLEGNDPALVNEQQN